MTEVPAHFGLPALTTSPPYSLHTEYAARRRNISPVILQQFPILTAAHRGVPLLWINDDWALAFAEWLILLISPNEPPSVVELHPPFRQECSDQMSFLARYGVFAGRFLARFPSTKLVLENRSGSLRNMPFLISTPEECACLARELPETLRFCVDFPQFFTAVCQTGYPSVEEIDAIFEHVHAFRDKVFSVHLWGRKNGYAHMGDLRSLFQENADIMKHFLRCLDDMFDGRELYLVPEVNSNNNDLEALLSQIEDAGIEICSDQQIHGTECCRP
jgi:hypothetical protein